jgi:NADPH:quinone reductase-like Zn-dependent oxidoreductase
MRAARIHEFGAPEVIRVEAAPRPSPGPGEVLLLVAATSFNPIDAGIRSGHMQGVFPVRLPFTPGADVAGTVAELGDGVHAWTLGAPVLGVVPLTRGGAAAEFVVVAADSLTAAPARVPLADAAGIPIAGLTAWQAVFEHGKASAGQRVLVNGAGGGVGTFAVQFARLAGATVIATASRRSAETVRALGADEIVDYRATPLADAPIEPVDLLINTVALPVEAMPALVAKVRSGGLLVSITTPAEPDPERGVTTGRVEMRPDVAQLAEIVRAVDAGRVRVDVSERERLTGLIGVHRRAAAGDLRGKVIITPNA